MDQQPSHLDNSTIRDRKVCATGRLVFMSHDELADLVQAGGGIFVRFPTRSRLLVVLGADGWLAKRDGSPTRIVKQSHKLKALGYAIDFVNEDDFLERMDLFEPAQAIRGRQAISALSRILGVYGAQVRRWVRARIIKPVASPHPLARLDFHHVAFAKRIMEWSTRIRPCRRFVAVSNRSMICLAPRGEVRAWTTWHGSSEMDVF